jgi:uncharacterized protein YndB with AHSA1/START domain
MSDTHLKTTPQDSEIIAKNAFPVPIDRVWRAWTDPERLMKWFGQKAGSLQKADVDLRAGGDWRFMFNSPGEPLMALEGVYEEIEAPSRLVFSWRHVSEDAAGAQTATPYSKVAVTLKGTESGTHVQIRHSYIQTLEGRTGVSTGWDASLSSLGAMLEAEALAPA